MPEQAVFDALKYRVEIDKFWYQNGKLHRTDGPAVEWGMVGRLWYINGCMMTGEEFIQAVKQNV